jgi:hypothetical protein
MDHRLVIAPARPAARAFAFAAATTMLTALIGSGALAQAPPAPHPPHLPRPKQRPKAAPKAAPAQKPAEARRRKGSRRRRPAISLSSFFRPGPSSA